jgi:branched-chain amino acid transport system ATP-binding protein
MTRIRLKQIDAAYSKKKVLRDVNVDADLGEIVAIIGPNGAGKSTVLKVAAGMLDPDKGSVQLDGRDITTLPTHECMELGLGYCIQGGRIFPSLTVRENLAMGTGSMTSGKREANTAAMLEVFPTLEDLLDRRAGLLSGGERQALALSMVLVRRPEVLLLDEPSAGLAPKLVQDLLGAVRTLNEEWNLTVLLVEQDVRAALHIAHRAVALANGEVALTTERPASWLDGEEMEELFLGSGAASLRS